MKRAKITKIVLSIVSLVIALMGIAGISAAAADPYKVSIKNSNVVYDDMMQLAFTLEGADKLPAGVTAGVLVWNKEQSDYTVNNASYKTFESFIDAKGNVYYKAEGIAAVDIDVDVYVAACYKENGKIFVAETPFKYSIVDYFVSRLNEKITDVQANLYYSVLVYGLASNTVLNSDSYVLVKANGGYIGNFGQTYGVVSNLGESIFLRADAVNPNGKYFLGWADQDGNIVANTRLATVTPEKYGSVVYTPLYGELSESAYIKAIGLEYAPDDYEPPKPDLSTIGKQSLYAVYHTDYSLNKEMYGWLVKETIGDITIGVTYVPAFSTRTEVGTTPDGKNKIYDYEFIMDENNHYTIGVHDDYEFVEDIYGGKVAYFIRGQYCHGPFTTFTVPSTKDSTEIEIDLMMPEITGSGAQYFMMTTYKDADGTSIAYRSNIDLMSNKTSAQIYAEGSKHRASINGKESSAFSMKPGETVTITQKLVVDEAGARFDFYINGAFYGSLALTSYSTVHKDTLDLSTAYISGFYVSAVSSTKNGICMDNVVYK